jgi:ribose 1,5-bisphosphokinase
MSGTWVIVCGPSGAGKDSVLAWAAQRLAPHPGICFAPRLVTRASGPDSTDEEISRSGLETLRQRGELAWEWGAHGHTYGVRAQYAQRVAAGELVVVNGSRAHANTVAWRRDVRSVLVTAPAALLGRRLRERRRESEQAIAQRMARNAALAAAFADQVIVNDAGLDQAGAALRDYLLTLAR